MDALFVGPKGDRLRSVVWWVLIMLGVLITAQAIATIFGLRYIGAGIAAANTIQVSGHGEVYETPDLITFSYSVVSDKSSATAAQADATAKANAVTDYLKQAGVDAKDIQTSGYSVYPQYEYQNAVCPQMAPVGGTVSYCPPGKQVLTGYEARQTTTVKVRDLTKAGDLLVGVGTKGATEVSGLTFTFDNPNQPQDDARNKAIADAKAKADALAKQLGVTLVRVVNFSESGAGNPRPIMYATSAQSGAADKSVAPEISPGQNQVSDDVTVTYEIR